MQEISLNILDIAQNSIVAKADLIEIEINKDTKSSMLTIKINDNGCGMSEEKVKNVTDPFYTTRTTRKVGLGVPFFKMGAEMTGGSFEISSVLNVGTKITAVYKTDHIDCIPLGDVDATLISLIMLNETIDFLYREIKDGDSFIMDTREFRAVLGDDVALNTPEVLKYIKEYLTESREDLS